MRKTNFFQMMCLTCGNSVLLILLPLMEDTSTSRKKNSMLVFCVQSAYLFLVVSFLLPFFFENSSYGYHAIRLCKQQCDSSCDIYDANATNIKSSKEINFNFDGSFNSRWCLQFNFAVMFLKNLI